MNKVVSFLVGQLLPGSERTVYDIGITNTTLQSMMNAKLSQHRFWPCHENGLIKTIQTIPHNLYVSFKFASLYCGLRLILVYPKSTVKGSQLETHI